MSRALPPTCPSTASVPTEDTATRSTTPAAYAVGEFNGSCQSWDPLRTTDRFRYALVYEDRDAAILHPLARSKDRG